MSTVMLTLTACGDDRQRLVAFGHSYVEGHGEDPWPELAADVLDRRLENEGRGGTECVQIAEKVEDYSPRSTDVVTIEAALNDVRRHGSAGVAQYRACLARMLRHLNGSQTRPARVILISDPPITGWGLHAPYDRGSDDALGEYRAATREAATAAGVGFVDAAQDWDTSSHIAEDQIHPTDTGAAIIAERVAAAARRDQT